MEQVSEILFGKWFFDSPLEKKLYDALREFELYPEIHYPLEIFILDFAFPEKKLAIEVDGFEFHKDRKERDEYKNKRLRLAGWKIERFPGWFVYRYPKVAAAKIALRYFSNEIKREKYLHAKGIFAQFFIKRDFDFGVKLI